MWLETACLVLRTVFIAYVTVRTPHISLGLKEKTIVIYFNETGGDEREASDIYCSIKKMSDR